MACFLSVMMTILATLIFGVVRHAGEARRRRDREDAERADPYLPRINADRLDDVFKEKE